jgi:hypothetical protein
MIMIDPTDIVRICEEESLREEGVTADVISEDAVLRSPAHWACSRISSAGKKLLILPA